MRSCIFQVYIRLSSDSSQGLCCKTRKKEKKKKHSIVAVLAFSVSFHRKGSEFEISSRVDTKHLKSTGTNTSAHVYLHCTHMVV